MKQTVKHFLFMDFTYPGTYNNGESYEKAWRPIVRHYKATEDEESVLIREVEIEVDIPDDFDPTGRQIAALEKKKSQALAEYQATVAEINKRLSELQAISA